MRGFPENLINDVKNYHAKNKNRCSVVLKNIIVFALEQKNTLPMTLDYSTDIFKVLSSENCEDVLDIGEVRSIVHNLDEVGFSVIENCIKAGCSDTTYEHCWGKSYKWFVSEK
jgi:hypothetical protein